LLAFFDEQELPQIHRDQYVISKSRLMALLQAPGICILNKKLWYNLLLRAHRYEAMKMSREEMRTRIADLPFSK